jgi:outer membrane lipoprotein-sorting protein
MLAQKTPPKPIAAVVQTPVSPESVMSEKIKDLTASLRILHEETNFDELGKIGGAFATSYRIPRYDLSYKWPNKLRAEGKAGPVSAVVVYINDTKAFKALGIKKMQDVKGQPGQKQSLMDVGIFARDWLTTDYQAAFVKRDGALIVFKCSQRNSNNRSHEIVWVNPKTAITERRLTYNGDNVLQKEIRYKNPKEIAPGIYLPTRIEIYNQFGKLGAAQTLEEARVNVGLADSVFEL